MPQEDIDQSYKQYKLIKELKDKVEYINDFTDVTDLEVYCDLCDRKLVEWEQDTLICPVCHVAVNPRFTVLKHKPSREGPVDDELEDGNDISNVSEYYQFQKQREEKDPFIDSLKASGYQIISSTKK